MLADICVLAVVVFFVYAGYRAGFMKSLIKIASYLIAVILSFSFYPVLSAVLMKTPVYQKIVELVGKNIKPSEASFGILSSYIDSGINSVSEAIGTLLVNIIAFVVILIAGKILIRLIGNLLGIFTKLPVIKQFNHLGGGILGGILGILMVYIICAVVVLFLPLNPESTALKEIENSTFASEIYENNIVLNLLGKGQ